MAEKVIRQVEQTVSILGQHPFAGRARDEIRPNLRSIRARAHIVFHRVDERAVEVVRVLHGRRDIEAVFSASDSP